MDLKKERKKIDQLDALIITSITKRIKIAASIKDWRKTEGLPRTDQKREQEILANSKRLARHHGTSPFLAAMIIKKIIAEGKRSHKFKNPKNEPNQK